MNFNVVPTLNFEKELKTLSKKYPSLKADLLEVVKFLRENPTQNSEIFKNCYKVRIKIKSKGRGKSVGGRLITFIKIQSERVYLLSIYDKSERSTIIDDELRFLLRNI